MGSTGVVFTAVDKFEVQRRDHAPDKFEITEKSRGGHPLYRTVLKNGEVSVPSGTVVGPEEIEADRRKGTRPGRAVVPKAAEVTAPASPPSSATPSAPASGVTPAPGPTGPSKSPAPIPPATGKASSSAPAPPANPPPAGTLAWTPWLGVTLGVAAAIGLLLLLLKMRK
jgi:hypothetical protein